MSVALLITGGVPLVGRRHHKSVGHAGSARLRCSLGAGGAIVAMAWRPSSLVVVACSARSVCSRWDSQRWIPHYCSCGVIVTRRFV